MTDLGAIKLVFYSYPQNTPELGEAVLAKINARGRRYSDTKYYVCTYELDDHDEETDAPIYVFQEADGEQYACWSEEEVEAWMPIDDLDNIKVELCRIYRPGGNQP